MAGALCHEAANQAVAFAISAAFLPGDVERSLIAERTSLGALASAALGDRHLVKG